MIFKSAIISVNSYIALKMMSANNFRKNIFNPQNVWPSHICHLYIITEIAIFYNNDLLVVTHFYVNEKYNEMVLCKVALQLTYILTTHFTLDML